MSLVSEIHSLSARMAAAVAAATALAQAAGASAAANAADVTRLLTAVAALQAEFTRWTARVTRLEEWAVDNGYDGSLSEESEEE